MIGDEERRPVAEFMRQSIAFCSTCTMSSVKKFTFAISSPDECLVMAALPMRIGVARVVHGVQLDHLYSPKWYGKEIKERGKIQ